MAVKHNGNHSATEFHPPETSHRWHVLGAVEIGNFLVYMDSFVVTLALPWMMREFEVPVTSVKWVVVAYLLPLTIMVLTAGRIADMVGLRRPVTLAGMILLTMGSGLCFIAPTFGALVAFRVVQGLGGALVLCTVMSSITYVFPAEQRTLAMSINASVLALGQVTGLVLGGFLIGRCGWRPVFLLIAAFSMVSTVLLFFLKSQPTHVMEKRNGSFDWAGSIFSILGIGALFMGFDRLGENLNSSLGYALIPAGLILMIVFVFIERSARTPLLDPSLFRSRVFVFGSSAAGMYFIAAVACYFMMPFYLQVAMGHSPLKAGILMVPMSLALTGSSFLTSRLAHRFTPFSLSTAGMFLVFASMVCFSTLTANSNWSHVALGLVLLGAGGGLFHPSTNSSVLSSAPAGSLSTANGYLSTTRTMGQVIGAALAAQLLRGGLDQAGLLENLGGPLDPSTLAGNLSAYTHAQTRAFRVAAVVAAAGILISMLRGRGKCKPGNP